MSDDKKYEKLERELRTFKNNVEGALNQIWDQIERLERRIDKLEAKSRPKKRTS